MTEQQPDEGPKAAERPRDEPDKDASRITPISEAGKDFAPDSTEGRGGRPEDLNPDDFE